MGGIFIFLFIYIHRNDNPLQCSQYVHAWVQVLMDQMKQYDRNREALRLAALESYDILDTPREKEFDDIAALAADLRHADWRAEFYHKRAAVFQSRGWTWAA
ncbi:hypothetical protein HGG75_26850 [Ochrobactrum pseudogrignonense]|nr:hypothetical protein [Brucella pseudogrignonensis]